MKKIVLAIVLLTSIVSCKNDKKETEKVVENETPEVKEEVVKKDFVLLTLNAVVPKDDTFVLQFTEDPTFKFKASDKMKVDIKGSNVPQDVIFKLPNKVIPTKFMLKVGRKNYEGVTISKLTISNEDRVFEISKENFYQFFNPNKYIDYNREEKTFTSKEIDGRYIPTFISRPVLIQRLEEIVY